jgi:hypothetical protein
MALNAAAVLIDDNVCFPLQKSYRTFARSRRFEAHVCESPLLPWCPMPATARINRRSTIGPGFPSTTSALRQECSHRLRLASGSGTMSNVLP